MSNLTKLASHLIAGLIGIICTGCLRPSDVSAQTPDSRNAAAGVRQSRPAAAAAGVYCPDTGILSLNAVSFVQPAAWTVDTRSRGGAPVHGDWDGDGVDSWGIFNAADSTFALGPSPAESLFRFTCGAAPALPLAGDWDNDGRDSVGLYYPEERRFCLSNRNAEGPPDIDFVFEHAPANAAPISGRWTNAPGESVGLYAAGSNELVLLARPAPESSMFYSWEGNYPTKDWQSSAGDWDGDGIDTVGFVSPDGGTFCVRAEHPPSYRDFCLKFSSPAGAKDKCLATAARLAPAQRPARITAAQGLQVCLGYNPEWRVWSQAGNCNLQVRLNQCPSGQAMFGSQDGRTIGTVCGTCCPLPSNDILTEEHIYVRGKCPEGYVVTGVRGPLEYRAHARTGELRCTRLGARYQLGAPALNLYYGYGVSAFSERAGHTIRSRIPAALRWGIGRASLETLEIDGCISYPWGSLLAGAAGKCHGMSFQQLEYRGLRGDPAAGTPVKVYPDCSAVSSMFDANALCLP